MGDVNRGKILKTFSSLGLHEKLGDGFREKCKIWIKFRNLESITIKKVIRNFGGWKDIFFGKNHMEKCHLRNCFLQSKKIFDGRPWLLQSINQLFYFTKSINQSSNQITSKFKRQDPFLERKKCPGFWRPENGHPILGKLNSTSQLVLGKINSSLNISKEELTHHSIRPRKINSPLICPRKNEFHRSVGPRKNYLPVQFHTICPKRLNSTTQLVLPQARTLREFIRWVECFCPSIK